MILVFVYPALVMCLWFASARGPVVFGTGFRSNRPNPHFCFLHLRISTWRIVVETGPAFASLHDSSILCQFFADKR